MQKWCTKTSNIITLPFPLYHVPLENYIFLKSTKFLRHIIYDLRFIVIYDVLY